MLFERVHGIDMNGQDESYWNGHFTIMSNFEGN